MKKIEIYFYTHDEAMMFGAKNLAQTAEKFDIEVVIKNISEKISAASYILLYQCNGTAVSLKDGSYQRKVSNIDGNVEIEISGHNNIACMYALIDLADFLVEKGSFENIDSLVSEPYMEKRGIKFNIPLDARTPSYSDAGDSSRLNIESVWDYSFWTEFIDLLALYKYNVLSLWNLHPFPSMTKVDKYPEMALEDVKKPGIKFWSDIRAVKMYTKEMEQHLITVKKMTIVEKMAFWNNVFDYAVSRGIEIYICTWNIFLCGCEGKNPLVTLDQENDYTIDYFKESVKSLFETYPQLAGIGITSGEQMDDDLENEYSNEKWLHKTYFQGIKEVLEEDVERKITLIHRAHMSKLEDIESEFKPLERMTFDYSFKYSQAHMYGAIKPSYGDEFFDFLSDLKSGRKTWLTVRNDDFYMYRWGNVGYAKEYIKNMPQKVLRGIYIGPDGYTWGREFISRNPDTPNMLVVKKMWYSFMIWGKLAYNPDIDERYFVNALKYEFELESANDFYIAWSAASEIIPEVNRMHFHDFDFQWYPEACTSNTDTTSNILVFQDVNNFASAKAAEGSGYISIKDFCNDEIKGEVRCGVTPEQGVAKLSEHIDTAKKYLGRLERNDNVKYNNTLDDIEALIYLGEYYYEKISMAIEYQRYLLTKGKYNKQKALEYAKNASEKWRIYSEKSFSLYKPQYLTRMLHTINVLELQEFADNDIIIIENI